MIQLKIMHQREVTMLEHLLEYLFSLNGMFRSFRQTIPDLLRVCPPRAMVLTHGK